MKLRLLCIAAIGLPTLFQPFVRAQVKSDQFRKIHELIKLSDELAERDPVVSSKNARAATALSRQLGYTRGVAYGMQQYAAVCMRISKYDTAKQLLDASQKLLLNLKDNPALAKGYNLLGSFYLSRGSLDTALLFFSKGMKIATAIGSKDIVGRSHYLSGIALVGIGNFNEALKRHEQAEKIGIEIQNDYLLATAHEGKANAYAALSRGEEGIVEYQKAIKLYERLDLAVRIARCKQAIAWIYGNKGEYDKALVMDYESLRIMERFPSIENIAMVVNHIGTIHYMKGDYANAKNYFTRALDLNKQVNNIRQVARTASSIADIYRQQKKYDSALFMYRNCLQLAEKTDSKILLTMLYVNIGSAHFEMGAYDSSLYHAKRGLAIADKTGSKNQIIDACAVVGESLVKLGKISEGMPYLKRSIDIAEKAGSRYQLNTAYKALASALFWTHNFEEAFKYHVLNDSIENIISNEKMNKDMHEVEVKYETEKKDKILAQNNLTLNEQRLKLAQNKVFIAALTSGILLLIMIGFFVRYKQKKRQMAFQLEYDRKHFKIEQQLELTHLKAEIFTNVSHEFRTPLTLLLTPLEQLIRESSDDKLKQRYEMMYRNANQLLGMVNQLLELSKIENGYDHLRVACYDLSDFLRDIIRFFEPLKEKQQTNIILLNELEHPYLYFDREKLEKVFYNLLSNAFKYADKGQLITINLQAKETNNKADFPEGFVQITVKDAGKGIAAEHIPYIFNRFYQVDGHSENGSGIGLALVKEIVEMHSGEVTVTSKPGSGTEFTVILPVGKNHFHPEELLPLSKAEVSATKYSPNEYLPEDWADSDQLSVTITPEKQTVLIVEDNAEVNKYVSELFKDSYNVIRAENGQKGLELAKTHALQLVICDVMMPVMDGYAFTSALKSNLETSHIPVILLTAKADQKHKLDGLGLGADDYITKPFHVDELLVRSNNLVVQRRKLLELFSKAPLLGTQELVTSERDQKFIQRATDIVMQHIDDLEFDVDKFSKEIGMSYTVLNKKLKAVTGHHITRFIRCIRLKKAIELIECDAGTMSEIATWVGFNNRQFFIRSFREQYGMTPTEYKIGLRKRQEAFKVV